MRKGEARHGTCRTKALVLTENDRMAAAGVGLTTPLVDGENRASVLTLPLGPRPSPPGSLTRATAHAARTGGEHPVRAATKE
ncbi:hypothetical protein KV205_32760 [Streptomyces sp. SKN60]|uniref:hypothetical protein n=1 Tax=Streptomyces sp. SKN60 TaxID=2855506 RepID=UPI002246C1B5|nr:hypothetical protein [Streptomyces sp. SKN60]MCX2185247.1 hypothetical protein [Streptomyces sp. SKN60]